MAAGTNVRGAMVGRNVVFPGDDDPLAIAEAAGGIIHRAGLWTQARNRCLRRGMRSGPSSIVHRRRSLHEHAATHHGPGAGRLSEESVCGARRLAARVLCRDARHLWPRQRRGHRPGPAGEPGLSLYSIRNEQSGVHLATGFAKASNRLRALACTPRSAPARRT